MTGNCQIAANQREKKEIEDKICETIALLLLTVYPKGGEMRNTTKLKKQKDLEKTCK